MTEMKTNTQPKSYMKNSILWRRAQSAVFGITLAISSLAQAADEGKPSGPFNIAIGFGAHTEGHVAGFSIHLNDIGDKLLKRLDTDKDGGVSYEEFKTTLQTQFNQWDVNKSGSLSTNELSAGLKAIFPAPEVFVFAEGGPGPGPGEPGTKEIKHVFVGRNTGGTQELPEPPDLPEPSVMIAKRIFDAVDTDKNKEISAAEWEAATIKWFKAWDDKGKGSLNAEDLAYGFDQLAGPPDDEDVLFILPE